MKVIICGAGQVGWQIARQLSGERNDVTVVDNNPQLIARISDTLEVRGLTGHAGYPDVLERAGARDADMLIAATHSDEVNMVACQVAHSVFGVPRKIARVRAQSYLDPAYADLYRRDHLSIDVVISPEKEVAEAALQRIAAPAAFDTESFFGGRAQLLGIAIAPDCAVLNTPLRQLSELFPTLGTIVVGVRREDRLFAPEPGDQLFPGDQVYAFTATEDVNRTLEVFGKNIGRQERIVILGGGAVGLTVARKLEAGRQKVRVRIIERDRAKAEAAADTLQRTIVLNGDGLDLELMREAGVDKADALFAVTEDDKTNLLACVRAKAEGAKIAIALINDPTLAQLMPALDIDAYINPRATTVSSILRHVRHGRVRAIYSIGDSEAEIIEAQVLSTSPLAGRMIREIEFPEGVLVGGIMRAGRFVKPGSATRLEEGDVIAIFALAADVPKVERLLQVSIDFF